jgi:hypothetical protein
MNINVLPFALIRPFQEGRGNCQTYTNGAYEVYGYTDGKGKKAKLHGVITKTQHPHVYAVGTKVEFPVYHLPTNDHPQFFPKQIRTLWDHLAEP